MIRNKAFVVRLYPDAAQTELISRTLGCARFVYNHFLARRIETYRHDGEGLTYAATDKALILLKRDEGTVWLAEVDKFALHYNSPCMTLSGPIRTSSAP